MKLQQFTEGLNTRLASHLLGTSESLELSNVDTSEGPLLPVKDFAATGITLSEWAYYFVNGAKWVSSSAERDYLEYQGILYYTDGIQPKKYDGTNEYNLGIVAPTNAVTIADTTGSGSLTGTYSYVYTFYNSVDGTESAASLISADATVTSKSIVLDGLQISTDSQVNQKRIYRIGGSQTSYTLVDAIPNSQQTYTDTAADSTIAGNDILESDHDTPPTNLRYLTEAYGYIFGISGDRLYYNKLGYPDYWPANNYIQFDAPLSGIGVTGNGIIVFSLVKGYIITGTGPTTFSRIPLSGDQGCVNHKSIVEFGSSILWVSQTGVCHSSGGEPEIISMANLGEFTLSVKNAVLHKRQYYIFKTDNTILTVDNRFALGFKDLDLSITNIVEAQGKIYGYSGGDYKELFAGTTDLSLTYLSPVLLDGAYTELKTYKDLYVRSEGSVSIEVYISGTLVKTYALTTTDTHNLKIPQDKEQGYSIQFKITGTGKVFEIDYDPFGRQK